MPKESSDRYRELFAKISIFFDKLRGLSWDRIFHISAINRKILYIEREIINKSDFNEEEAKNRVRSLKTERETLRDIRKDRINFVTLVAIIITAIATAVLAYFSQETHSDTLLLLNEQKSDTEVQDRAYLSITDNEIISNYLSNNPAKPLVVRNDIRNNGLTPANNVRFIVTLFIDGNEEEISDQQGPIIDPGQTIYSETPVSYSLLQTISNTSNNYLQVDITYTDYEEVSHFYITDLQVQFTATSTGLVAPTIKDNYEDSLSI